MEGRNFDNWLDAYLKFVEDTESPTIFHKWTGISMVAAVLQKKVRFEGVLNIFPNLYIVFIGPPGSRKTQSMIFGNEILENTKMVSLSADATSMEAFIQDLADSVRVAFPGGKEFRHSSMTVTSKEFEVFLGQKAENTKMLVMLTDLFDCPSGEWKYRTIKRGKDAVQEPFLNLLGATTPASIVSSLPISAIGGGFTSRILFVYAPKKEKSVPRVKSKAGRDKIRQSITDDLINIGHISGTYGFTDEAGEFFDKWYIAQDHPNKIQICPDALFEGWYTRKATLVVKMCMILKAMESNEMVIDSSYIKKAIDFVEEVEVDMDKAFSAVGRSDISFEVDLVFNHIRNRKWLTETELRRLVIRDIDDSKFKNVITTLKESRLTRSSYLGPGKVASTWHICTEFVDEWKKKGGGEFI